MRVKFTCNALAFCQRRQMHSDAIETLVVSCADGATYCVCEKKKCDDQSMMSPAQFHVDFDLAPIAPFNPSQSQSPYHHWASVCRDTLKLHVFGPERSFIASGFVPMESLFHGLANSDDAVACCFQSNAAPNSVMLLCTNAGSAESRGAAAAALEHLWNRLPPDCPQFRSCLRDTDHARVLIETVADHTRAMLLQKLSTPAETGAMMFSDVLTHHGMQDQCTTEMMFQADMEPPTALLDLMLDSGAAMYFLSDSMHFTAQDAAAVERMFTDGVAITQFMSTVCQSAQRSNTAQPYLPDRTPVIADPTGRTGLASSEYFARTFSEPFSGKTFLSDDCEGSACELHNIVLAFGRLAERWEKKAESRSAFAARVMPPHMFSMGEDDKLALLGIGVKLGEHVRRGDIESSTILVTAGGKSQGDNMSKEDPGHIGGHVAHVVLSKHRFAQTGDARDITEILTEGTNLSQSDIQEGADRYLRIPIAGTALAGSHGDDDPSNRRFAEVSLGRVANFITTRMALSIHHDRNTRTCLHMSHLTPDKFYNTAFCQGSHLLAMDITPSPANRGMNLQYGIPVHEIGDYSKKVFLTTTEHDTVTGISPRDYAWLGAHLRARASEIHTPLTSLEKLDGYLRRSWTPTTMYRASDALAGRSFINCIVCNPLPDAADRERALGEARTRAERYNQDQRIEDGNNPHRYRDGYAEAWIGMDCVMERISLFTDDMTSIEHQIQRAMQHPIPTTIQVSAC